MARIITNIQVTGSSLGKEANTIYMVHTGIFAVGVFHGCLLLFLNTIIKYFYMLYFLIFLNDESKIINQGEEKVQIKLFKKQYNIV